MSCMAAETAMDAVIELLSRPAQAPALVGGGPDRPGTNRPWTADADTIDVLKERTVLGRRLYAVGFDAEHVRKGQTHMTMLVRAEPAGDGWVARSMSGVSGPADLPRKGPRVKLGGSWGRFGFCGGGPVEADDRVERVGMRFANGVELEDDTHGGWVLFFTDRPVERPDATVDLLDHAGESLARFEWPWSHDLPDLLRQRIPTKKR
jgi:hypothetical protein